MEEKDSRGFSQMPQIMKRAFRLAIGDCRLPIANWHLSPEANRKNQAGPPVVQTSLRMSNWQSPIGNRQLQIAIDTLREKANNLSYKAFS